MGLSTFDIPSHFLYPNKYGDFLSWLTSIPAPDGAKRRLLITWAQATHHILTLADFDRALSRAPREIPNVP